MHLKDLSPNWPDVPSVHLLLAREDCLTRFSISKPGRRLERTQPPYNDTEVSGVWQGLGGRFGDRTMGTQVLEDELREIGTDCDRHCYLAKDSGFYHVGSGMTLRGGHGLAMFFFAPVAPRNTRACGG